MTNRIIQQKLNQNFRKFVKLDFIYNEISKRMVERLEYIKLQPKTILDIGSGLAIDSKALNALYTKSKVIELDLAINFLKLRLPKAKLKLANLFTLSKLPSLICADALDLPLQNSSIDLVWSNLTLPYIQDINTFLTEIRRVLVIGGVFLISGFGVDTFWQLREMGLATYDFPDMHLIGDMLVKLGFNDPVTDREIITIQYNSLEQLLLDIRSSGCGALANNNMSQRLTKANYRYLQTKFNELSINGVFELTLEVYYAHSWKDKLVLQANQHPINFK